MHISQDILSQVTVAMKYSKYIPELNRRETWRELVDRNMQMHVKKFPNLEKEIIKAYQYVYDKKILPSMRSMQFAGKPIEVNPTRIFNCAYLPIDDWRGFQEVMFLLLSGTGVGFSVQQHHVDRLPQVQRPDANKTKRYLIGDSIEGWADAVKTLMRSYFKGGPTIRFDYSDIRAKGARLVTSGGKAPGPQPLKECLVKIEGILNNKKDGEQLTSVEVYDIVCHEADAVLAGGIRRAALICLFSADDEEMISAKSGNWWELNPQRGRSNNSAVLLRYKLTKSFFMKLWKRIEDSGAGEPGIYLTNDKDWGTNPCVEIALRPFQFCNLVEINASNIESQQDFNKRAQVASFIATLQASYTDFHYLRSEWKKTTEKDALLGVSMTGIASMEIFKYNIEDAVYCVRETNEKFANIIGINKAARLTCVKPAGTTSLTLGTSSGIHAWHAPYYIRRIRVGKNESIYTYLLINHPELIKDEAFRPHDTAVIEVPQKAPEGAVIRTESALSLLERVKAVSTMWVKPGHNSGSNTHNVSATISINKNRFYKNPFNELELPIECDSEDQSRTKQDEWQVVGDWMWKNREFYAGLAVLPYNDHSYIQAPFENITKEKYDEMVSYLKDIDLSRVVEMTDETNLKGEAACAGGACEIV